MIRIGFTVGVFDLFHHGHAALLDAAMRECDHLIVGVTTDWLARVQKGHDRPAQSYETRKLAVQRYVGPQGRVIAIDTLDMTPYLQMVDV